MPKYYRFGYAPHDYEANWRGWGIPGNRAAATRGLGNVMDRSQFFRVPKQDSPYWLHKKYDERPPIFKIPRRDEPYWLHEQAPAAIGATEAGAELKEEKKRGMTVVAAAAVAGALWYFARSK